MSSEDILSKPEEVSEPESLGDAGFAENLKRLEAIVKSLESGELSLEDSLKKFEEGIKLARYLESVLDRAERKVEQILNPEKSRDSKGEESGGGI